MIQGSSTVHARLAEYSITNAKISYQINSLQISHSHSVQSTMRPAGHTSTRTLDDWLGEFVDCFQCRLLHQAFTHQPTEPTVLEAWIRSIDQQPLDEPLKVPYPYRASAKHLHAKLLPKLPEALDPVRRHASHACHHVLQPSLVRLGRGTTCGTM